jgi:hypothetical protein
MLRACAWPAGQSPRVTSRGGSAGHLPDMLTVDTHFDELAEGPRLLPGAAVQSDQEQAATVVSDVRSEHVEILVFAGHLKLAPQGMMEYCGLAGRSAAPTHAVLPARAGNCSSDAPRSSPMCSVWGPYPGCRRRNVSESDDPVEMRLVQRCYLAI